jgi:DNA-binding MarR family transcriptional regulator
MARPEQISNEAILNALGEHPGVTAQELATSIGFGQSTAAKRLAALEVAGKVCREPGGLVGGRRVADHWSVLPTIPGTGLDLSAAPDVSPPPTPQTKTGVSKKVATQPAPSAAAPENPVASGDGSRLGRGVLGALVLDYLTTRPEESFGPSAVGKALGRSGGAVSNSLAAMAERGEVVQVTDKPRRYQIATPK